MVHHGRERPIRILLVDDHALFRAGIISLMQNLAGMEIVGEASNGREALSFCKAHRPDVVLMDIRELFQPGDLQSRRRGLQIAQPRRQGGRPVQGA